MNLDNSGFFKPIYFDVYSKASLGDMLIDALNNDKRFNSKLLAKYEFAEGSFINVYKLNFFVRFLKFLGLHWLSGLFCRLITVYDVVGYFFIRHSHSSVLFYHYSDRVELILDFDSIDIDKMVDFFNGKHPAGLKTYFGTPAEHMRYVQLFMGDD